MRRGWMDWTPDEVPAEGLRARVATVAAACRAQGVDALLLHASFVRPAQVSALTHFVPFWSQAALVVARDGATMLTMATTGRTVQWIRRCAVVDEVRVGPDIGRTAGEWLTARGLASRIAIASPDDLPQGALQGLQGATPSARLEDADPWYGALDAGFGPTPAVVARAQALIALGFEAMLGLRQPGAHDLVAAVEGACRAGGAEDVTVRVAPDLARGALPWRLEGPVTLGPRFGLQFSLGYKGSWWRAGGSFELDGGAVVERASCAALRARVRACRREPGRSASEHVRQVLAGTDRATLLDWSIEARRGGLPLRCVAASGHDEDAPVPPFATLSLRLRDEDDVRGEPVDTGTGREWLLVEPVPEP